MMAKLRGYALIAALILVVLASLATTVAVNVAQVDAQRERELQLLFIGSQMREALSSYYASAAGGVAQFPERLEQLLIDERWPQPRHHLRRLWPDPLTGSVDWELVRSQGRIVGVHSRSKAAPLKRANFGEGNDFAKAESYADWVFVAREFVAGTTGAAASPPATPPSDPGATTIPPAAPGVPAPGASATPPPSASSPPARPEDPRAQCLRQFSQSLNTCLVSDPAAAAACRNAARDELRRCLG